MKKISDVIFDFLDKNMLESSDELCQLKSGLSVDEFIIESHEQEKEFGKPIGKYSLLSTPDILTMYREDIDYTTDILFTILKKIIGEIKCSDRVLIVGLGNRHISSDSLGAKVVNQINITLDNKSLPKVMAIAPSVLGLTGIETYDIISGVVNNVRPTHIILIDSLCAGAVDRLGRSIQVTNTGICPGSGIGNNRRCIDKSMADNVYSVGVPLLIFASTFIESAFNNQSVDFNSIDTIMQDMEKAGEKGEIYKLLNKVKKVFNTDFDDCIVSIKDIEECVGVLSDIIAVSINKVLGVG